MSIKNQDGFTLMDTMIVSAILLSMIATFAAYQYRQSKDIAAQDARNSVNQMRDNVKMNAVQPHSLGKSEELLFTNPDGSSGI